MSAATESDVDAAGGRAAGQVCAADARCMLECWARRCWGVALFRLPTGCHNVQQQRRPARRCRRRRAAGRPGGAAPPARPAAAHFQHTQIGGAAQRVLMRVQ